PNDTGVVVRAHGAADSRPSGLVPSRCWTPTSSTPETATTALVNPLSTATDAVVPADRSPGALVSVATDQPPRCSRHGPASTNRHASGSSLSAVPGTPKPGSTGSTRARRTSSGPRTTEAVVSQGPTRMLSQPPVLPPRSDRSSQWARLREASPAEPMPTG